MNIISKTIAYVFIAAALFVALPHAKTASACYGWYDDGYTGFQVYPDCGDYQYPNGGNGNNDDDDDNDNDSDDVVVETNSASNVDEDSATLRGEITDIDESEDYERYFEWGTDDDDLDNTATVSGTTDNEGDFSKTISGLSDDRTYYYRACAESTDSNDEDCGSIRSFTTDEDDSDNNDDDDNDNDSDNDNNDNTGVVTTEASAITTSSAILNGVVVNDGGSQRVWFAWGTTTTLGNVTSSRTVSGDQNMVSVELSGLATGQSYFFRLVSDSGDRGDVKTFTTKSASSGGSSTDTGGNTDTNTKPPTNISTVSQLNVDLVASVKEAARGETVMYGAVYENLSNTTIENISIVIDFPAGVTPVSTTVGRISGQEIAIFIPALAGKAKGDFTIEAKVNSSARTHEFLVSVIEGSYEHPADEETLVTTLDYAIVKVLRGNDQAAGVWFAGGLFDLGLFGWIILIGMIVIIILLARLTAKKQEEKKQPVKQVDPNEFKIAR